MRWRSVFFVLLIFLGGFLSGEWLHSRRTADTGSAPART